MSQLVIASFRAWECGLLRLIEQGPEGMVRDVRTRESWIFADAVAQLLAECHDQRRVMALATHGTYIDKVIEFYMLSSSFWI